MVPVKARKLWGFWFCESHYQLDSSNQYENIEVQHAYATMKIKEVMRFKEFDFCLHDWDFRFLI